MSKQVIVCPICHAQYDYLEEYAGHRIQCDNCESKFFVGVNVTTVPSDDDAEEGEDLAEEVPTVGSGDGTLLTKCPSCDYSARVPRVLVGHQLKCPLCQSIFRIAAVAEPKDGGSASAVRKVEVRFVPDLSAAYPVTLSYPVRVTVKIGGRAVVKVREKTVTGKLGDTLGVVVPQLTKFRFSIGRLSSGTFDGMPGRRYEIRKVGIGWRASEVLDA